MGIEWNVPVRIFRMEFGVWNSFVLAVIPLLVDVVVVTIFVVRLLMAGLEKCERSDDVGVDAAATPAAAAVIGSTFAP